MPIERLGVIDEKAVDGNGAIYFSDAANASVL